MIQIANKIMQFYQHVKLVGEEKITEIYYYLDLKNSIMLIINPLTAKFPTTSSRNSPYKLPYTTKKTTWKPWIKHLLYKLRNSTVLFMFTQQ